MEGNRISFDKYRIDRDCEDVEDDTLRPIGEEMLAALKHHGFFYMTNSGINHETVSVQC